MWEKLSERSEDGFPHIYFLDLLYPDLPVAYVLTFLFPLMSKSLL